jgi:hypothetical protein
VGEPSSRAKNGLLTGWSATHEAYPNVAGFAVTADPGFAFLQRRPAHHRFA